MNRKFQFNCSKKGKTEGRSANNTLLRNILLLPVLITEMYFLKQSKQCYFLKKIISFQSTEKNISKEKKKKESNHSPK